MLYWLGLSLSYSFRSGFLTTFQKLNDILSFLPGIGAL